MQDFVGLHETASDVRDRLSILQRRHREVNHALIEQLAQDYHDEALELYLSKDDAIESEEVDVRPHYHLFSYVDNSQYLRRISIPPSH